MVVASPVLSTRTLVESDDAQEKRALGSGSGDIAALNVRVSPRGSVAAKGLTTTAQCTSPLQGSESSVVVLQPAIAATVTLVTSTAKAAVLAAWTVAVLVACHDRGAGSSMGPMNKGVSPPSDGRAEFSVIPVVGLGPDALLTPLGNLNPPGHVLPTDHVYFYAGNPDNHAAPPDTVTRQVLAPATGAVDFMLQPSGMDWKVDFIVTPTFHYYLDHLLLRAGLKVGDIVHAGEVLGTTDPGGTLDLGAYDYGTTLSGFATPGRYPDQTVHCVSPWKYFMEPLRSQFYARIHRAPTASDKDGKIDFDAIGRLVGGWFLQSLSPTVQESSGPDGWPKTVAFVYDSYDPTIVRISIGGTIAPPGVWGLLSPAQRPENVTVASGKVSYRLTYLDSSGRQYGLMLVQMLTDSQIRIEVFVGSQATTAEFDAQASVYVR